jgi:TatD DNase family protein
MTSIVDTHCHLDLEAFDVDRDEVIHRSLQASVHATLLIGYNPDRWRSTADLCSHHANMCRAVGVHPNDARIWDSSVKSDLISEIRMTDPVAIGEIGLDFYRSTDNADEQCFVFEQQLELAARFDLPVIIHQRSAEDQVLEILAVKRPPRGVMHCFTGDYEFADRCLDLGLYLGIGGVATFPRSDAIRTAIRSAPDDRLLLETDAPFLAPQSRRGKRNESSYLPEVVDAIAKTRNSSSHEVRVRTTQNAIELFGQKMADAIRSGLEHE